MKLAIYDKKQEYHTDLEGLCDENCILQVMDYYGIRDPLLYFDIVPHIRLYKDETAPIGYSALVKGNSLVDTHAHKVKKHEPAGKPDLLVWEENKAKLKEGIPVIAGIDNYLVNCSPYYQVYHSNHKCILCGYSEDEKYASVIDWYEWEFKGEVPMADFLAARASLCPRDDSPYSGYPIGKQWLEVEDTGWQLDKYMALKENLDRMLLQYYEGREPEREYREGYYGMDAIREIEKIFSGYQAIREEERVELIKNMRVIFLFIYMRQKFIRYYMTRLSRHINMELLSKLLDMLESNIQLWYKTTVMMLKGTVSATDKTCEKIESRIKALIEEEEKKYDILVKMNQLL